MCRKCGYFAFFLDNSSKDMFHTAHIVRALLGLKKSRAGFFEKMAAIDLDMKNTDSLLIFSKMALKICFILYI